MSCDLFVALGLGLGIGIEAEFVVDEAQRILSLGDLGLDQRPMFDEDRAALRLGVVTLCAEFAVVPRSCSMLMPVSRRQRSTSTQSTSSAL